MLWWSKIAGLDLIVVASRLVHPSGRSIFTAIAWHRYRHTRILPTIKLNIWGSRPLAADDVVMKLSAEVCHESCADPIKNIELVKMRDITHATFQSASVCDSVVPRKQDSIMMHHWLSVAAPLQHSGCTGVNTFKHAIQDSPKTSHELSSIDDSVSAARLPPLVHARLNRKAAPIEHATRAYAGHHLAHHHQASDAQLQTKLWIYPVVFLGLHQNMSPLHEA